MRMIAWVVRAICTINTVLGRIFSVFSLAVVLVCFTVVVMRYAFRMGSVPMQDLYVWLNGMMFMGIAGHTFLRDGHVRVDIFYRGWSMRRKAAVDMFGCFAFVLPFLASIAYWSYPYIQRSWALGESSANFGGLDRLYLLKSFIFVFAAVVALQAIAMVLRSVLVLRGRADLVPPAFCYADGEA